MIIHILPINDMVVHINDTTCGCNPCVKFEESGDMTVVHMAFDNRQNMNPSEEKLMGGWEIIRE